MAQWNSEWKQLVDYLAEVYPGTSVGMNDRYLVTNMSNDNLDEAGMAALTADVRARFPLAFEIPAPAPAPAPVVRPTRECPECGERILAVARKCRFCLSVVEPLA